MSRRVPILAVVVAFSGCGEQSDSILATNTPMPIFDTSRPEWSKEICRGGEYLTDEYPPYQWMQVLNPDSEADDRVVGLSGTAVEPHIAGFDVPFSHPFGKDFVFSVIPDPAYERLMPAANLQSGDTREAIARGFSAPKGVIGVETDQDLIPPLYRCKEKDRVVVFGRWIVDAAHGWYTEIHPPLLLVSARPGGGAVDPDVTVAPSEATSAFVISRPWLVGQRYEVSGKPLRRHLVDELIKVLTFRSLRMEAHPKIYKPFTGIQMLTFTVKPPSSRKSPNDRLMVHYHFTTRNGVAVQAYPSEGDSVKVTVVMNEAAYQTAPLPPKRNLPVPYSFITSFASVLSWVRNIAIVLHPYAAIVLSRDWYTDVYDAPQAPNPAACAIRRVAANNLGGGSHFSVDDSQPFPIYGQIRLQWERNP